MMGTRAFWIAGVAAAAMLALTACGGRGDTATTAEGDCQGQQTVGITDTSVKLGGVYPLSGPASAYGDAGKGVRAYFDYLNAEKGGINGRKVEYLLRDDSYQPPKTVEEIRRLVEQDQVFAIFQTLGTATSSAVWDYLNQRKVPQVFVAGGATKWGADPAHPWTIGWQPSYRSEGRAFARYVRQERPDATVAVLYQNDDFGKDLLDSFRAAVAGSGVRIVAEQSYETTDPTVEPQVRTLAGSKADVLLNFSTPKFAAQTLAADARATEWNPLHIITTVSNSVTTLAPVGLENIQGVVSAAYTKDPADPARDSDPAMREYKDKLARYGQGIESTSGYAIIGWASADSFAKTLAATKCPTREGLRDAMRNLDNVPIDLLLPGVSLKTGNGDAFPIEALQIQRLTGDRWSLVGDIIDTTK
ncbi:ABC transporter substrate-binding protein [Nocardia barduliensis]|uniref:ABC transporter substrate-binding protein n=1 Tax=Nocardia barduliensis TaxID=2736643 RepID=UPI001FECFE51|nr:ABC transporter substrate-binding protein [Nocardia barduliensis]